MSEVHRYKAVKMLTAVGSNISYSPHGPWVVLADEFDRVAAECKALQQRLNIADQEIDYLLQTRVNLAERDALLCAIAGWTTETRAAVLEAFQDELNESASYA